MINIDISKASIKILDLNTLYFRLQRRIGTPNAAKLTTTNNFEMRRFDGFNFRDRLDVDGIALRCWVLFKVSRLEGDQKEECGLH